MVYLTKKHQEFALLAFFGPKQSDLATFPPGLVDNNCG